MRIVRMPTKNNKSETDNIFGIYMKILLLLAVLFLLNSCASSPPVLNASDFVKDDSANHKIIIFVHGITGDVVNTWTDVGKEKAVYFPSLLANDPELSEYNVYSFSYYTPMLKKAPTIPQLSVQLNSELASKRILPNGEKGASKYDEIIFVAHSMGNLVIRQALQDRSKYQDVRVRLLISMAAPNAGSEIADIAKHITPNNTVAEMSELDNNAYLQALNNTWKHDHPYTEIACAYETLDFPRLGRRIVSQASATYMCTRSPEQPFTVNHSDIVKPSGITNPIYDWVRSQILMPPIPGKPFHVLLMDNAALDYDLDYHKGATKPGHTNSQEIEKALLGLNLKIEFRPVNADFGAYEESKIVNDPPDLVVIHFSSFSVQKQDFEEYTSLLRSFLISMKQTKTKFIVYTRWKPEKGELNDFFKKMIGQNNAELLQKVKLFDAKNPSIEGKQYHIDQPTFRDQTLQRAIRELVKASLSIR